MKVVLGADHAGFALKEHLERYLLARGYDVHDVGAHEYVASDDYPDFAFAVADAVVAEPGIRGIVCCGSGVGAAIAANKVPGIRASVCHDVYTAHQGVEHDAMNVLCLGGKVVGESLAEDVVLAYLEATFIDSEPRYKRRVDKIAAREG